MVDEKRISDRVSTIAWRFFMGTGSRGGRSPCSISQLIYDSATPKPLTYTKLGQNGSDKFAAWLSFYVPSLHSTYHSITVTDFHLKQRADNTTAVRLLFTGAVVGVNDILRDVRQFEVDDRKFSLRLIELPKTLFGPFRLTTFHECVVVEVSRKSTEHDWKLVAIDVDRSTVKG